MNTWDYTHDYDVFSGCRAPARQWGACKRPSAMRGVDNMSSNHNTRNQHVRSPHHAPKSTRTMNVGLLWASYCIICHLDQNHPIEQIPLDPKQSSPPEIPRRYLCNNDRQSRHLLVFGA